ncbi:LapA family protein [Leptodesmis sichuanensis]|uniref:LapA family protein n=1 Tax=Leptodesmis sichuanensis TaxID=2906798 RepID=UPI001F26B389|nr:LapA family protein [Leptodesmis sichuanensis]UIE39757.1 LapA family protein [Leptodesmis sichuanensis A121]
MRQVNFFVIFVICLALVLFGIENTEPAVIHLVKGVDLQAPLSIELILAMGLGAVLAWVFSVWTRLQRLLETGQEVRVRDERIQALEEDVERYKAEIEQQRLLPAAKSVASETQTTDAELVTQ